MLIKWKNRRLHSSVLAFIKEVRESFGGSVTVYTQGSCGHFGRIMQRVFPKAVLYTNVRYDHVVARVGERYYDITGEVDGRDYPYRLRNTKLATKFDIEDPEYHVPEWFVENNYVRGDIR